MSEHHNTIDTSGDAAASHVSRRLIVKGAAWSVPAVAVASAVPAFAASTDQNLQVTATDCSLVTLRLLNDDLPGFTYTVTEGTVPAGTQITISTGGTAAINVNNFVFDATISLTSLGGDIANFETQRALNVGESFTIGLSGLTVNVVGTYTTNIIGSDAVDGDDIAIMTAGGVGLGGIVGAFICFQSGDAGAPDVADLPVDVAVAVTNCFSISLLGRRPRFTISTSSGTIPAGTPFLFYSTKVLGGDLLGAWSFDSGQALNLDLLGTGSQAAQFETTRDITPANPMTIQFEGLATVDANSTYYLAYLGNDTVPTNNAGGMIVTGAGLGPLFLGTCQQATQ